jgi:hypothetical protein
LTLLHFPNLDIRVQRIALTFDQVREHNLPTTPFEKNREARQGLERALGARADRNRCAGRIAPGHFAEQAMEKAIGDAQTDLSTAVEDVLARMRPELDRVREQQSQTLQELHRRYELVQQELSEISLPEIDIPEPEIDKDCQPEPLFTTADDFIAATRKLIASKALEDEDDC